MIYDDYINYQTTYEKKYGEKTIVLMEVGGFFEFYGVENAREVVGRVSTVSDLLNIQMTRKNKSIPDNDRNNPLMAGFPSHALKKFVQILIHNNYTVVLVEQVTEPPNPVRRVTDIYSPGTYLDNNENSDSNNIVCIYIEIIEHIKTRNKIYSIGLSSIDITTGKNTVYEVIPIQKNDDTYSLDETFRFIQVFNPKEILLCIKDDYKGVTEDDNSIHNYIIKYLEIENRYIHTLQNIDTSIYKIKYVNDYLHKIFPHHGMLSVIEYLNLENRPNSLVSYMLLLQYCYEHNENIIHKIDVPTIWESNGHLLLENNSMLQLNVIDNRHKTTRNNSLFGVVNNTSTSLGRRYLYECLLNPITDPNTLYKRYDFIDFFLSCTDTGSSSSPSKKANNDFRSYMYVNIESYLQKIIDIERLHRRMYLKILNPCDFIGLDTSLIHLQKIIEFISNTTTTYKAYIDMSLLHITPELLDTFTLYMNTYKSYFDFDHIHKYALNNITNSFFNKGIYSDIDTLSSDIDYCNNFFTIIANAISHIIDDNDGNIKVEYNERDGFYLQCTSKRSINLQNIINKKKTYCIDIPIESKYTPLFNKYKIDIVSDNNSNTSLLKLDVKSIVFKASASNATVKLHIDIVKYISDKLIHLRENIKVLTLEKYLLVCEELCTKYGHIFNTLSHIIATIDFFKSAAKSAIMYNYKRPIIDTSNTKSYIIARDMRHPIIERIQTEVKYITNDVEIGVHNRDGILLYGVNASGKSSFMKAIGLNIILAQAGLFVACRDFTFVPYIYIFTRILNTDNIFKGQSSFAVEMSELRSILKRSNQNSLILGDELCSGTESISAVSIVAAGIITLSEKRSSYVFATHLHGLAQMERIKSLENLHIYHVKVFYDNALKTLVYDRKLAEGSGESIYGLEVCKAMDLDRDFLELANTIRNEFTSSSGDGGGSGGGGGESVAFSNRSSRYNSNIYYDMCNICRDSRSEHIHHIQYAETANSDGMIDHFHKNSEFNLVALCEKCHHDVHNNKIYIHGYITTSDGIQLKYDIRNVHVLTDNRENNNEYKNDSSVIRSKLKYSGETLEYIYKLKEKTKNMSEASRLIKRDLQLNISINTIKKIWENTYLKI